MPTFAAVHSIPGAALLALASRSARSLSVMAEAGRASERDVPEMIRRGADWASLSAMGQAVGLAERDLLGRATMRALDVMEDDEPDGRYSFRLSTSTPDRANDIVQQDWRLDNFRANPIALWAHDYSQPAVGSWDALEVRDGALFGVLIPAAIDSYPLSLTVAEQLRRGVLRTVSVGFRAGNVLWRGSEALRDTDLYSDRGGLVFQAPDLIEVSLTPTPMNPEATLQRALPLTPIETARAAVAAVSAPPSPRLAELFRAPVAVPIDTLFKRP